MRLNESLSIFFIKRTSSEMPVKDFNGHQSGDDVMTYAKGLFVVGGIAVFGMLGAEKLRANLRQSIAIDMRKTMRAITVAMGRCSVEREAVRY